MSTAPQINTQTQIQLSKEDSFLQEYLKTMSGYTDKSIHGNEDNISKAHPEYYYKSILDFVSQEGKVYQPQEFTSEEYKYVRKRIRALNFSPKQSSQSFHNSCKLAIYDSRKIIKYVEGYIINANSNVTPSPVPRLHAWNEINGKVIDITITDRELNRRDGYIMGKFKKIAYRGIAFQHDQIFTHVMRSDFSSGSIIDNFMMKWPLLKTKFTTNTF